MENVSFNQDLNVFVQVDAVKSMSDYDKDHWVFEGIASTKDMDLYNEVVYPESFLNSIEFFKDNGKIFFDHDYAKQNADWLSDHGFSKDEILSLRTPIGKPLDAKIKDDGLYIKAMLNKEHPMAKLMWNQYLNNPDASFRDQLGLSIGAKYLGEPRKEFDIQKGKHVTYLPDLLLYEVSLTPEPVNPKTKSWASTLKSFMKDADNVNNSTQEHHKITPDEIVFDEENSVITVKSTVEDADGIYHVFESQIDLKEDIKKSMENIEDSAMKNVVDSVENSEVATEEMDSVKAAPPVPGQEEEQQMQGQPMQGEAPEQEGAPMSGGEEGAPEEGMGEGEEGMDDEGASSVLEELAAQSEEGEGDEAEGEGGDDSQEMLLDKMDTVLDALGNVTEMLQELSPQEEPAEEQVTTETPGFDGEGMKSVVRETVEDVLKSFNAEENTDDKSISISEESAVMLADTIKSAISETKETIVNEVVERVLNETVVTKSVEVQEEKTEDFDVVHPGTQSEGVSEESVDSQVMKSVPSSGESEFNSEQMDTLKSMVSEYVSIRGYTADKSQQRANIIERASEELNLHPSLFQVYVNKAHKGKF